MKYKKIHIQAFRGIKELEIDNLSKVNVFLGQNNSGKSSILEAIFLLTGFNSPALILNIDLFRNLLHSEEDDFRFAFYNLDYASKLLIEGELVTKNSYRKLEIIPKNSSSLKKIQVQKIKATINGSGTLSSEMPIQSDTLIETSLNTTEDINSLEFKADVKDFQTEKKVFSSSIILNRTSSGMEFSVEHDPKKYFGFKAILQGVNFRNLSELSKRIENLIVAKKKAELIRDLKQIENRITDITTSTNSMIYVDIGAKRMIPSNLMGDGFLKYMNIVANINEVKDGILLIDEIDNGLHFTSMKKLWKTVLLLSEANNSQLFITTHSKESLMFLKEVIEEDEMIQYKPFVKCYTVSKLADNTVKAYPYDFDSLEYAIENDIEIRGEI